jgi:hypothetical protein
MLNTSQQNWDNERLKFGKHKGSTYIQVYDNYPGYVQFLRDCLAGKHTSYPKAPQACQDFLQYCASKDGKPLPKFHNVLDECLC